jgi:hypothetical protein
MEYKISPAFSECLIRKMQSDHDQGFPRGVKVISNLMMDQLVQLEKDLDQVWQTMQNWMDVIHDKKQMCQNPQHLGQLFHGQQSICDSIKEVEEVANLLIGRTLFEATLGNTMGELHEMELEL